MGVNDAGEGVAFPVYDDVVSGLYFVMGKDVSGGVNIQGVASFVCAAVINNMVRGMCGVLHVNWDIIIRWGSQVSSFFLSGGLTGCKDTSEVCWADKT